MATLERQDLPRQAAAAAPEAEAGDERVRGAVFRAVNDKLIRLYRGAEHEIGMIVCECARAGCTEPVEVSLEEYEAAHASPSCFLVAPGHEFACGQRPVMRTERFVVVEERPALRTLATTDPETGNSQSARPIRDLNLVLQVVGADRSGA
jgi:hypothetical protein